MNKYEQWLKERIAKIEKFRYEDIERLKKYPSETAQQVLSELIKNACESQNCTSIELGRKKIGEIDKRWLAQNLLPVANATIDFDDECEYRRLVELVIIVIPELKEKVLEIGLTSKITEIRDAAEDYVDISEI